MLYPDFNDLVSLGDLKSHLKHPAYKAVKSGISGNYRSAFRGQGLEFDSVREYVPGDDIRNIDWRVTARTGLAHLKVFQEERERHIVLCVDMNAAMRFGTRNTFKSVQAARIAALLGWSGIAHQDRVSACFFGDVPNGVQFFPPKRTKTSLCFMLKMLSSAPSERHNVPLKDALSVITQRAHTGSLVYLISDFMEINKDFQDESVISALRKKCDVVFISMNDPADKSIAPVGTVGFHLNDSDKVFIDTENLKGRKAYEEQWEEHERCLHRLTSQLKIPLLALSTESDVRKDLTLGLNKINRSK